MSAVVVRVVFVALSALALAMPAQGAPEVTPPLDVEACVALALGKSPKIAEAEAKVAYYRGVLSEVEALFYPKLFGMGFIAPMYTVRGDVNGFEAKWQHIKYWGPYMHFEATLAQPLYTFGRLSAGEEAAGERLRVEEARVREAENLVALEVRKMYYLRSYAQSMLPSLGFARDTVVTALEAAREMYADATGDVTQADINKLEFGLAQVRKYMLEAEDGAALALSALKHLIGLSERHVLVLNDERLSKPAGEDLELAPLLVEAAENRPEWAQLRHGAKAALALEQAELLANAPVVFAAGIFRADWAPTRDDTRNPYHFDQYNNLFGGVAVGLQFDIDVARSLAKAEQARGLQQEVEALRQFASTGIPLQVRKAWQEVNRFRTLAGFGHDGEVAARKWMTFAGAAYVSGAGEAKDVLEGLVAYITAKQTYYEAVRDYFTAEAELTYAVGRRVASSTSP